MKSASRVDIIATPEQDEVAILSPSFKIPPRPAVLNEIYQCGDDIERIADAISNDLALSAAVLKTINSPYYGLKSSIGSVRQATLLLGIKPVTNIVTGQLLKASLHDYCSRDLDDFWQSSSDVAHVASALVKLLGYGSPDEAYTLGIFHNCGIPLLMNKHTNFSEILQLAYDSNAIKITDLENQHFNTNHAVVGYMVSRTWELPDKIRSIIRDHHRITDPNFSFDAYNTDTATLLAILKMAEHMADLYASLGKNTIDVEWEAAKDKLLDFVGVSDLDFLDIEEEVRELMLDA